MIRPQNAFGLHDVRANALEWTEDCVNDDYSIAPPDTSVWRTGDSSRHMLRGGSWFDDPARG